MPAALISRRCLFLLAVPLLLLPSGCMRTWYTTASQELEELTDSDPLDEKETIVVGDLAGPYGMRPFKVESIALVTGLRNTGSDPAQSPQRDILMGEMKRRDVANPNAILASPQTAMVFVRAYLPPGVRKGDRVDIDVITPNRSETSSLEGGWMMPTRLTEMAVLEGRLQTGHDRGMAQGYVLTSALLEGSEDPIALKRGRILGGGVALQSRPLGLALRTQHKSVRNSSLIAATVNRRFSIFDEANIKRGVAEAKRDNYIELAIYPSYRNNLWRYVRVVSEIPLKTGKGGQIELLESLRRQLLEPASSSRAALKLEAIGKEGIPTLEAGLQSDNQEVRFYAAEALAYLDHAPAAPELAKLARDEPAFRWHALTAMAAMNDLSAVQEIVELLHVESAETRYGAFRAMLTRNAKDPAVRGEMLGDQMALHVVKSEGPSMVHISRSRKAEVAIFGDNIRLAPVVLATSNHVTVKYVGKGQFRVSRFAPGEEDQQILCSDQLADITRQIIAVGGTYPDVAHVIRAAKEKNALSARVEVDALPRPGRKYYRDGDTGSQTPSVEVASPLPTLFTRYGDREESRDSNEDFEPEVEENQDSSSEDDKPRPGILGRIRD